MRGYNKFAKWLMLCGAVLMLLCGLPLRASAEVKEADFVNHDGGTLTFSFFYEVEKPDLVFISPSGVEYAEGVTGETELEVGHGDGWSTYQIPNAEAGQWKLRYDKKGNESIRFVEVEPVVGIAIQSFDMTGIEGDVAHVTFDAMKGEESVRYSYAIHLVDDAGNVIKENLATGWGYTMEVQTVSVQMKISTGQDYRLMLVVNHNDGNETFDSEMTDVFTYTNPNTPAAMADFEVLLNSERSRCTVDWYDYRPGNWGYTYSVTAIADGDRENPIYVNEAVEDTTVSFFYPTDASKLEIEVSYIQNGITSEVKGKTIDLMNCEYLKMPVEDVVSDALLPLEYSVKGPTELKVTVNGVEGAYMVDGEDVLYLTLQNGSNLVEATFVGADGLVHSASKEVFYTWVSPTIMLFENLEGMTFKVGNVPVSGKVTDATAVKVNGVETEVAEDGSFYCQVPIVEGKNTITVEAVSVTGVSSMQTVTVVGEGKAAVATKPEDSEGKDGEQSGEEETDDADESDKSEEKSGWKEQIAQWTSSKWFPTVVAAVISVLVLIFFFITLRNKKKKTATAHLRNAAIGFGLLEVILGVAYFFLYRFNNSLEYVELARDSVQQAAMYLKCETYGVYVLLGVGGVIVLLVLSILAIGGVKKLRAKSSEKRAQRAALKAEKAEKKSKNRKEKNKE